MALTAETWPIAAALLPFPPDPPTGAERDAEAERRWDRVFRTVADAGFDAIDLTDTWVPFGDLSETQRAAMRELIGAYGLRAASLSVIRRSVTDERAGDENLAYSHRCIDLAAEWGVGVVSVGLHRPLTEAQRAQLWFWTAAGHRDPDDPQTWALAVRRLRELGRHAEEAGVLLSLEMYEHTYLGTGASAVRLVEDIGMDVVGLNPDIGNLIRLHESVEDWREVARQTLPYANYWHVKNYTRDEDAATGLIATSPTYLESGLIDYRTALGWAIDAGFQGVICTEHYGGDGLSMSAANREYLRGRILPRRDYVPGRSRVRQQFPHDAEVPR
jgi:sugar phosphate isomerase/epimerase